MRDMYFYRDFLYLYSQEKDENTGDMKMKLRTCFLTTEKINEYLNIEDYLRIGYLTHRNLWSDTEKEQQKWERLYYDWDFFETVTPRPLTFVKIDFFREKMSSIWRMTTPEARKVTTIT